MRQQWGGSENGTAGPVLTQSTCGLACSVPHQCLVGPTASWYTSDSQGRDLSELSQKTGTRLQWHKQRVIPQRSDVVWQLGGKSLLWVLSFQERLLKQKTSIAGNCPSYPGLCTAWRGAGDAAFKCMALQGFVCESFPSHKHGIFNFFFRTVNRLRSFHQNGCWVLNVKVFMEEMSGDRDEVLWSTNFSTFAPFHKFL